MNLAPTSHHPLGPSTWPAISECADFESIPDVDLEEIDGEEAEEDNTPRGRGIVKHKAVAMLLGGDLAMRQGALEGLSESERGEVQWVAEKAVQIAEQNGYTQSDMILEQRVTMLKPDSFEPLYFGTGDGEVGPIDMDWKFGLQRNYFPQLVGYALPKMEARNEKRRIGYLIYGRLKRVERYVLDRRTVETVDYGLLARRLAPDRKPTPCSYCGFCAKAATCSALSATPVALTERREDWVTKLPSPHVSQLRDPTWLGAAMFIKRRYLDTWTKAVDFACASLAAQGITPAGFNIQHQKGRTSIADMQKAFAVLEPIVGPAVLWDVMGAALGTLAKAYAADAGIPETRAKAAITGALEAAGLLSYGEPIIKLVADKNAEAIIRTALDQHRFVQLPEKSVDLDRESSEGADASTEARD